MSSVDTPARLAQAVRVLKRRRTLVWPWSPRPERKDWPMAYHALGDNFSYFFQRLNPSLSFQQIAAREHATITGLIQDPYGLASELAPQCFLQGSYKQSTAIYTINDVDTVTLCRLWCPGSDGGKGWGRDAIFDTIAAPLLADLRYRDKVRYSRTSMCIKVDLGIKIEILPVVYKQGNNNPQREPFCLYRPERGRWEDGFARYHQQWLSAKNATAQTAENFIPAIKVLKHLRSKYGLDAVSFHIECFLFRLPDQLFLGGPADYIAAILAYIATTPAEQWYQQAVMTPCGERDIFTGSEWRWQGWKAFHDALKTWAECACLANQAIERETA